MTTPYQAVVQAEVRPGNLAVVIGVGGMAAAKRRSYVATSYESKYWARPLTAWLGRALTAVPNVREVPQTVLRTFARSQKSSETAVYMA